MGRHEPLDVDAAVRAAPAGVPVVTVGMSLGGAVVLLHAGAFGGVAGTVAISAPSSWTAMDGKGSDLIRRWVGRRSGRALMALLLRTRISRSWTGRDCEGLPEASTTTAAPSPVFTIVVHDPDDWYFGPEHAERIYEWASEPKDLWWLPGAGHATDMLTPALAARLTDELGRLLSAGGSVGGSAGPASSASTR